jgi:hypothetical protein
MNESEKSDIMHALELGLDCMILERDEWLDKNGEIYRPHVLKRMNLDIKFVEKVQELLRLS